MATFTASPAKLLSALRLSEGREVLGELVTCGDGRSVNGDGLADHVSGSGSAAKFEQAFDDAHLICLGKFVIKRQPEQTVTDVLRYRATLGIAAVLPANIGKVQRQIVEYANDAARFQMSDQCLAALQIRQQHIIHVIGLVAVAWNHWWSPAHRACCDG